jgi:ATP-binding cassette subfamily F protein uup
VSHDRYFLNRVCTDILAFEGDGRVAHSVGDYEYYSEKRARALAAIITSRNDRHTPAMSPVPSSPAKPKPGRPRRLSWKEAQELQSMEQVILQAEENVARIEALFTQPDFHREYGHKTNELTSELAGEKSRVVRLYERWQELEGIRAATDQ